MIVHTFQGKDFSNKNTLLFEFVVQPYMIRRRGITGNVNNSLNH